MYTYTAGEKFPRTVCISVSKFQYRRAGFIISEDIVVCKFYYFFFFIVLPYVNARKRRSVQERTFACCCVHQAIQQLLRTFVCPIVLSRSNIIH